MSLHQGPPPYVSDIRSQPAALSALLDAGVAPGAGALLAASERFDRLVLTGMGASLYALYPSFLRLAAAGRAVWCIETAELLSSAGGLLTPSTLLVVASQSGESAEVVELLDRRPRQGAAILGLTNDDSGTLAARADEVLLLHAGTEHAVGTRTYVNTLAAAALAADLVLGTDSTRALHEAPPVVEAHLATWDERLAAVARAIPGRPDFVLGRGPSLASARAGALILKEAAHCAAEGMSVPQFRHGPLELADDGLTVVLLAGAQDDHTANTAMRDDLVGIGATCVWVDADGDRAPDVLAPTLAGVARPIAEIVPLQLLSVVVAQRSGAEPGRFRHVEKVTRTL